MRLHGAEIALSALFQDRRSCFSRWSTCEVSGLPARKTYDVGRARTIRASAPLRVTIISPNRPYVTGNTSPRCSLVRGAARNDRFKEEEDCERNNYAPGSNKSGREHPP